MPTRRTDSPCPREIHCDGHIANSLQRRTTGPHTGFDAPICQDGRSGGFTELLARAEVSHDALIDFPSEKACKASG